MRALAFVAVATLVAGCATTVAPPPSADADTRECLAFYADLDARIDAARVRDAQDARIPGFPYLRASRLLASYREQAAAEPRAFEALLERMSALDLRARRVELANLGSAPEALERAQACAARLRAADRADPARQGALLARVQVPDDYSDASRVLGVYALSRLPFTEGVKRYQQEVRDTYSRTLALGAGETLVRYVPARAGMPRADVARLIRAAAAANPLGIPEPARGELETLFDAYAPVFETAVAGDFDRIGALQWTGGVPPTVDASRPVVYRQASWTRVNRRALLQLSYTAWFAERPAASSTDLLAGKLDGLVWRVTLDEDGEPLLYDTMHPCGCYHMFYPTPRAMPTEPPAGAIEWMFSPQALPRVAEGERAVLRVAARTHYLERVRLSRAEEGAAYELRDADELRTLPKPGGGSASAFGPDGLVAGTERPERFLFWPMGIPSAGAMRQWGRHATAFVGRRHFDDADLIERRFRILPP